MILFVHRSAWEAFLPLLLDLLKVLGILPGAAAAFWLRHTYQKRRQREAIESWPGVEARIHSVLARHEGRKLWIEVTYTYFVSEYRLGKYVQRVRKGEDADRLVRELKDKKLQARYDPERPDKSVILDRDMEMVALLSPQFQ